STDPVPSPQSSPRPRDGGQVSPAGGDGDGLPIPSVGGDGEMTQGEPLLEGHVSPADRAEEIPTKPSMDKIAQRAVV
ncbi:hypothetical protein DVA78_20925, partial [Acinetobacter baumannii]